MADFVTGAGATFWLCSDAPPTYNQAGYETLSFTKVGKTTNIGDIPSKTFQEVVLNYLESAGEDVAKGGYSLGAQTIVVALDADDAGQALVASAIEDVEAWSAKLAHPRLGTIYARALVMGGPKTWGDQNTPATWAITIRYKIVSATEDGIVTVDPA